MYDTSLKKLTLRAVLISRDFSKNFSKKFSVFFKKTPTFLQYESGLKAMEASLKKLTQAATFLTSPKKILKQANERKHKLSIINGKKIVF